MTPRPWRARWRAAMPTSGRGRATVGLVVVGALALAAAAVVRGNQIAASASVSPGIQYLADPGSVFTFTVTNTGTVSLGAVEIRRPASQWVVTACPSGPAGWTIQRSDAFCRYRSADGPDDDLAPGVSVSAFQATAATSGGPRDRTGEWQVQVSQTNNYSNPNTLVAAAETPPGLDVTVHSWEVLDAVVAASPGTPGEPCPPANREALTSSTQVIVICGRNRTSQTNTPSAALSSLGGSFVQSPGTFTSGPIGAQSASSVVIGSWSGVVVSGASGTDLTVTVLIRSEVNESSPLSTLDGYHAINRPPTANDDDASTDEDSATTIDVLANDTDPESQALAVTGIDSNGTVGQVTNNGTDVAYDPAGAFDHLAPGQEATDTFSYTVDDGHGGTDTATVTVTITGVNDAPDAVDDGGAGFTTDEDTAFTTGNVLANDTDVDGGPLSVVGLDDSATQGLVTDYGDGTFAYDPSGVFSDDATDTFSYTISDGNGGTDTATVTITITGVNDPPTAVDDAYGGVIGNTSAAVGTTPTGPAVTLTGDLLSANDSDPDDATLTASLVSASPGADVSVNADGSFVYVPPAGLTSTTDTFTYRVTDAGGLFDDATVEVAIGADIVWYVKASAVAGGDGRSSEPFDTLAPLRGAGDADDAGAILFLYAGSYAGGLPLESSQELIGEPAGLTVGSHVLVPAGGSNPVITNAAGNGIQLADDVSVTSVTVDGASLDGIAGDADGAAVAQVVVANSGRHGIHLVGSGVGSTGMMLTGSMIRDSAGTGLIVRGSGSTTSDVTVTGNTFDGNASGINLVASLSDQLTFDIAGNTLLGHASNVIQVLTAAPTSGLADAEVVRGKIRDNTIGGTEANSGSRNLFGIAIEINGDADAVIEVTGNVVSHTDQEGIFVQTRLDNDGDGDTGRLDLTLRNNAVGTPDDDSAFPVGLVHGVRIESRNTTQTCLDIAGNASSSVGSGADFRLRQRDGSAFSLERFTGSGTSAADVEAFLVAENGGGSSASVTIATTFTGVADGACRNP